MPSLARPCRCGPHNMDTVRHMAMNLLRSAGPGRSLKVGRKLAGWNPDYSMQSCKAWLHIFERSPWLHARLDYDIVFCEAKIQGTRSTERTCGPRR
jgi:hypothetical protein